jgi:glycosyltransferase involved in cell wall biosynthesis
VISNVSKHHAYHMALAAQQIGSLQALITSGYLNADGWLARLLPSLRRFESFQRLGDRRSHDLDSRRVHSDWFPECLTYAMRHAPLLTRGISDYRWMTAKNDLFDRRVSRNLGKCDIFHSFEGCAHVSFKRAKRLGAVTMLEQPIMHPETVSETLTREYTQMGLEVPEAYRDSRMVHRKRQEYALADYIMVPAQAIADDFVAKGVSPSKLRVIPYGASAERFRREPGKRSKRFRILFVGTLCIRKGVHYLLEAFKRLSLADAELVFVGALDPDIVPILARYDGEFTYIPHLPQSELNDWYNRSSVFVLPSLAEGSAYVIYEAMTCGLPVIVTPHCGSVARDGEDGFVVAARNVEALMDRLLWLYEHPERSEEMGVSGMNHVSQFDWIHYMSRLVETWNEVRELRAANTHRSASP